MAQDLERQSDRGKDSTQRWARSWVADFQRGTPVSGDPATEMGLAPVAAIAARAASQARRNGHPVGGICQALEAAGFPGEAEPLGRAPSEHGWADPWLIGLVHEQTASIDDRANRGAWYTPRTVVEGLVALAASTVDHDGTEFETIIDPTCGGGAFLLAGLDYWLQVGLEPTEALARVHGTDIDLGAVTVSGWSVLIWAALHDVELTAEDLCIFRADTLSLVSHERPTRLVVGNPPFASPLRKGVIPEAAAEYRTMRSDLLGPYVDLAAIHLLHAVEGSGPHSVVGLVQPQSLLSGRDGEALRRHLSQAAPLRALWSSREPVFDAGVRACAVVLGVGEQANGPVTLAAGLTVDRVEASAVEVLAESSWADLAAQSLGAPALPAWLNSVPADCATDNGSDNALNKGADKGAEERHRRLRDLVTATAGFRDEYYGLLAACSEFDSSSGPEANLPLLTVGLVDPLDNRWGQVACRFGGRSWDRPAVALSDVQPARVRAWTEQRLRPKLVVATQSLILEPLIDRSGTLVPVTPLLSVEANPEDLDRVAAVLLAPPITAWAWRRWFGSAMSIDALKLSARQVELLPLPVDDRTWAQAAELLAQAEQDSGGSGSVEDVVVEAARIMNRAYQADHQVFEWWLQRYQRLRRRRSR